MSLIHTTWLGRYEVLSQLGSGGMGEIYLAHDTLLNRKVAIKFLPAQFLDDEPAKKRLIREAQAAAKLDHPNICSIHEAGEESGRSFVVMQYVEGETMDSRIHGKMELQDVLDLAIQITDALAEAHSHGIIHRDIKPQNIMVTSRGHAKVMDFGLAKIVPEENVQVEDAETQSRLTSPDAVMGTVPYMSPEQARGEVLDTRTDIFSLGCTLYEMISTRQPFVSDSKAATLSAILSQDPPPLARYSNKIPAELERIVSKTLAKSRDQRYQTAKDLLIDLKRLKHQMEHPTRPGPPRATWFSKYFRPKIAAPVLIFVVLTGIILYLFHAAGQRPIDSVAVLPFANVGGDPNTEYLSDGITESLINSLSRISALRVLPRSTVFRYKGREVDPGVVGRDLRVQAVLTGRVLQRGDSLNIQTELIDVAKGSQLWGEQYNRTFSDILAVQDDIAKEISENLRLKLTGEEQKQLRRHSTQNTEAYRLYLKGRYFAAQYTREGVEKGIDYLQQAIAVDPSYALAYEGLAYCYYIGWWPKTTYKEAVATARRFAQKALEIDDTLAEAHTSLGLIHTWGDHDWDAAEREFQRALALNPNYPFAHLWYGWYLQTVGKTEQSYREMTRAVELDPLSAEANATLGVMLFCARRYGEAEDQLKKTIDLDPNFWFAHLYLGRVYAERKDFHAAMAEFEKAGELGGFVPDVLSSMGYVYAISGRKEDARRMIMQIRDLKEGWIPPFSVAMVYAGLGEKDQAFEYLEKEFEESAYYLNFVKIEPALDGLRSDPRFQDLLRRMNLPH